MAQHAEALAPFEVDPVVDRLVADYHCIPPSVRTEGEQWWDQARREVHTMALLSGVPCLRLAAMLAALSPRIHWADNVDSGWMLVNALLEGTDPPPTLAFRRNRDKAWALLRDDIGPLALAKTGAMKTWSMLLNLLGLDDAVTVDVWTIRAMGLRGWPKTERIYRLCVDAVRRAAERVGIPPARLQAILWVQTRGHSG